MLRVFQIKDGSEENSRYFSDKIYDKHQQKFHVHRIV
jgi:hypothetical protein